MLQKDVSVADIFNVISKLPAIEQDELGYITVLNYEPFLRELRTRANPQLWVPLLAIFVSTLGKNKSGSENSIGRLQYFLNAFIEEIELFRLNSNRLAFVGNDHFSLIRGDTGTDDPDFYFYAKNGRIFTLEVKMYWSEDSYFKKLPTTNFHKADYCVAFIISTKQWVFSRRVDNYNRLCSASYFTNTDPWLLEINLPKSLTTIKIFIPKLDSKQFSKLTDKQLVEEYPKVNYSFFTNLVIN